VECRGCRMVYTAWEPTTGELQAYYNNYPVTSETSPITLLRYDELLARFAKYRKAGHLLDAGCGSGHFLARAMARGWKVHGTEFGDAQIAECRAKGIPMSKAQVDPSAIPPGGFDVVCSFEVIEHVTHPQKELDQLLAVLRPGGLLYMTTPNFNCLARRWAPETWNVVSYPEHLNYFTPRTLHKLLRSKGMRRAWLETTGFSVSRWKTGTSESAAVRMNAQQSQEALREKMERSWYLNKGKHMANALLTASGLGDSMKAAYAKPS